MLQRILREKKFSVLRVQSEQREWKFVKNVNAKWTWTQTRRIGSKRNKWMLQKWTNLFFIRVSSYPSLCLRYVFNYYSPFAFHIQIFCEYLFSVLFKLVLLFCFFALFATAQGISSFSLYFVFLAQIAKKLRPLFLIQVRILMSATQINTLNMHIKMEEISSERTYKNL